MRVPGGPKNVWFVSVSRPDSPTINFESLRTPRTWCRLRSATFICNGLPPCSTQRGRGHVTDADVADVAQLAMVGLIQTADVA